MITWCGCEEDDEEEVDADAAAADAAAAAPDDGLLFGLSLLLKGIWHIESSWTIEDDSSTSTAEGGSSTGLLLILTVLWIEHSFFLFTLKVVFCSSSLRCLYLKSKKYIIRKHF